MLRYSGGKQKSAKEIIKRFPAKIVNYVEPFAGSFAVGFASKDLARALHYNDFDKNVYTFFKVLKEESDLLIDYLNDLLNLHRESQYRHLFYQYKNLLKLHNNPTADYVRAAMYYFVNRCSFNGRGEYGGYSSYAAEKRFTLSGVNKLKNYSKLLKNVHLTDWDYKDLFWTLRHRDKDTFLYVDPPYQISSVLYKDHKEFDHNTLKDRLEDLPTNILVSYNDSAIIRELYSNWYIEEIQIQHANSIKTELLIRNYHA